MTTANYNNNNNNNHHHHHHLHHGGLVEWTWDVFHFKGKPNLYIAPRQVYVVSTKDTLLLFGNRQGVLKCISVDRESLKYATYNY